MPHCDRRPLNTLARPENRRPPRSPAPWARFTARTCIFPDRGFRCRRRSPAGHSAGWRLLVEGDRRWSRCDRLPTGQGFGLSTRFSACIRTRPGRPAAFGVPKEGARASPLRAFAGVLGRPKEPERGFSRGAGPLAFGKAFRRYREGVAAQSCPAPATVSPRSDPRLLRRPAWPNFVEEVRRRLWSLVGNVAYIMKVA